jgi:archaellum component FlaC
LHEVHIRGPEGESVTYEKGKKVRGTTTVKYMGFERHLSRLRWTAQGIPPEIQDVMERMNQADKAMNTMMGMFGRIKS